MRVCCVCDCEAASGRKKLARGEPRIIAISAVIYRRGTGKGQLRNAPRVQVCDTCLEKALTNGRLTWIGGNEAAKRLWAAMSSSILSTYEYLTLDDLSGFDPKAVLKASQDGSDDAQGGLL